MMQKIQLDPREHTKILQSMLNVPLQTCKCDVLICIVFKFVIIVILFS